MGMFEKFQFDTGNQCYFRLWEFTESDVETEFSNCILSTTVRGGILKFLAREIGRFPGEMKAIVNTVERYISISKCPVRG